MIKRWETLFKKLIQTPSEFGGEPAIVHLLKKEIETLKLTVCEIPHTPEVLEKLCDAQLPISHARDRSSLVVIVPGNRGGRSLILNAHLDTVAPGDISLWRHNPYAGDIEDGWIFGRGAMDNKAGVMVLYALLDLISQGKICPPGDVIFQFVLEDEITGNGTLLCVEAGHVGDAAAIVDGTRLDRAIDQHAGNMEFGIKMRGKPASVSVSHMGVNAAENLCGLLLYLKANFSALNSDLKEPWNRFPSPFQFVVQSISASSSQMTVPVDAYARNYVTFPPPHSIATIRQGLTEHAKSFCRDRNLEMANFLWDGFAAEPVASLGSDFHEVLREVSADGTGEEITFWPSTGTSDMRHFSKRGIPCIMYGPGRGENPHRYDERYFLDDLDFMVKFYERVIMRWGALKRDACEK